MKAQAKEKLRRGYSRGIFPALQALAVEAVVAEGGEDAVDRLVHPLQADGALRQLSEIHHRQTGSLWMTQPAWRQSTDQIHLHQSISCGLVLTKGLENIQL